DHTEEGRTRGGAGRQRLLHLSLVTGLSEEDIQRDLAEEGDSELSGLAAGAAASEEIDPLVARRVEEALGIPEPMRCGATALGEVGDDVEEGHILDHAQHR